MKKVLMGNFAASHGVRLARAQVVSAYPITPQTHVVEELSAMVARKEIDARFIKVESEHSAMACCIGASIMGARAFTATSSQGLLLMHELLHWAAAGRLPIVMVAVNRAIAPGWNIWNEQTDTLSQRDTGWIQLYCSSNQEILDTVIQAFKLAEAVKIPVMVIYDAFILSHTYEPVDIPDHEVIDTFLPPPDLPDALSPDRAQAFGSVTGPDFHMEFRMKFHQAYEGVRDTFNRIDREYGSLLGRDYGVIESYRCEDAEVIMVAAGSLAGPTRMVVDGLREKGVKAGRIKLKLFRPFPAEELLTALRPAKKILVLDRNLSVGTGGIFAHEIRAVMKGDPRPVWGFVAGLGGRDIVPELIESMFFDAIGADAPVSGTIFKGARL
jgi:pyruvate/2-oxoacid:ferredoxin oxidoreductase alpha subunit